MTDRTFKRISKIVTFCLGIYGINEAAWWWTMRPGWERELILTDIWQFLPTLGVIIAVFFIGQHLALAFWIRRAKPVDPDTLKQLTKSGGD